MKYYIIIKFQQDVKSKKGGSCKWHEKLEYEYKQASISFFICQWPRC